MMEPRYQNLNGNQQELSLPGSIPGGCSCSPTNCKFLSSPQEISPHLENSASINRHPIFPETYSRVIHPYCLHAAAINGYSGILLHAIAEGGLQWLEFRDRLGRTPLIYACLGDQPECVTILLKGGASPSSVDFHGRNAFHWAAIKGLYNCFKIMHKHENSLELSIPHASEERKMFGWRMKDKDGATPLHLSTCTTSSTKCCHYIIENAMPGDIDNQDDNKRTPLHWASAAGNAEGVKLLLNYNARDDITDEAGKTPLFYAVSSLKYNRVQCLTIFLEKSLDSLKWKDSEGRSALHLAVADQPDGSEIIKILISNGEFHQVSDKLRRTPMHWAAILGKSQSLMILLDHFPNMLSCNDEYGATALHYAAMMSHNETIKVMTASKHFPLEVGDNTGRTPLQWAVSNAAYEAAQNLVYAGGDLEHHDSLGYSALHIAALQGSNMIVRLLLEHGAIVNCKDIVGNTPFASACGKGHHDIITVLTENGAEVDSTNIYGRKPIHLASYHGHTLIAEILIKLGCDVNCKDLQGITPLHNACYSGHQDVACLLLERGAQKNVQDCKGWTPLHYAVNGNHTEVTQFLLEHHANPNVQSMDGKTVLDICYQAGNTMLVNQLLKFGAVTGP